ncbi:YceI-like domain-containing protein [Paenibacillus cellulosilyticus]|uniref:YceI-like domain-containing protein n=1 Tax=Paenibacillus cellulosilyticus TaxID=375489 RepID=A0A2V2Z1P1_9BACL|nr:YceI family protein [Paenibacillus cellulosilyticus]PWW08762.1 YceI-like domain-containing protein [Paenibacillus cellulosilyticus]QKS48318.1 YceI family protein [Paenibacillus cellulosilyticus]
MMKKKVIWLAAVIVVVAAGIVAYTSFNRFVGNNVEIESVMAQGNEDATTEGAGQDTAAATGAAVSSDELNGAWSVASGSKVYWSVTTSQETVNFVDEAVTGSWNVDLNDAASMTGEGVVDLTALDSGNSMRDSHVKEREDLLTVTKYPEATFKTKSISSVPTEWNEGTAVPVTITGTLTIKGIDKEVTFDSNAMYKGGQLLLSGKTNVTFADFGMTNPHSVALETQNEFSVQLELVLDKA